MIRKGKAQRDKLSKMTAEQLRTLRERLGKTRSIVSETEWKIRNRLVDIIDVERGISSLRERTRYWEGKLKGEHCPAREHKKGSGGTYICHCQPVTQWGRERHFKDFYPRCIRCEFTEEQKMKAGAFGRILNEKKGY